MGTEEMLERLKEMSNPERLAIIEAARRLIDEDRQADADPSSDDDPILGLAGSLSGEPLTGDEIERELYGKESS